MKEGINKEIDLSVSCYGTTKELPYDMAILPWGATEPHNYHLPYMTDCILSHDVSVDAAALALKEYGVRCMVLPPVTMGSQNPGQHGLPFCIHARYETQKAILTDIVASLQVQGLRKLVIINGHGGNSFKNMIRDLAVDFPDFLVVAGNYYQSVPAKDFFDVPGDHADEIETSVMMYYHPELVNLEEAGDGAYKPFTASSLREGIVWTPRNWSKVSTDTGVGCPKLATAGKGERFITAVVKKLAVMLSELAQADIYE